MPSAQTLKILFLAANPVNTTQLRLDEELRDIKAALQMATYRDRFQLEAVSAMRIEDMRRAMLRSEPQVVHFSGHGEGGSIYVEDKNGNARAIAGDAFANFLTNFPSVQCVVLNACYSEELGAAITKTVQYVVGMQTAVEDTAAISFAVAFYDVLGAGGTYERAFRLAANALELEGTLEAAAPVLVQKSESGADAKPAQPATPVSGSPLAPASLQVTRLASTQFKQFHAALLDAYTEPTLAQMTRLEMNVNLDAVAGGSNFSSIAFNLIDWAQRTGRLGELIQAAVSFVPGNPALQAFVASLQ